MSSPVDSAAERRAQITAQIKADTGIDEVTITDWSADFTRGCEKML